MPLYEYHCPSCGAQFEVSRPVSKMDDPVACPSDGAAALRLFSLTTGFLGARGKIEGAEDDAGKPGQPPKPGKAAPSGGGWSHFGHSHASGAAGHAHGGTGMLPPTTGSEST